MLAKRLIAVILLRDGRAVKSKRFMGYRDVGSPVSQARILYANGIDELVVLNTQPELGITPLLDVLPAIGQECFIPVAAGGGISKINHVAKLFAAGCEKVVIRSNAELIQDVASTWGSQAVIRCVDYHEGCIPQIGPCPAGELLLQNMDRDGMMGGYDTATPVPAPSVPVIRLGGCGTYQHMADAFASGADACAAGSLYAFTDSAPNRAKSWLRNKGIVC